MIEKLRTIQIVGSQLHLGKLCDAYYPRLPDYDNQFGAILDMLVSAGYTAHQVACVAKAYVAAHGSLLREREL